MISGVTGSGNSTESDIVAIRVQPDGRGAFAKRTDTCPDNSSSSATLPPVFESLQGFNGTVNAPAAASTTMSANTITPNVFKFVFSQPVLSAK